MRLSISSQALRQAFQRGLSALLASTLCISPFPATACINGGGALSSEVKFDPAVIPMFLMDGTWENEDLAEIIYLVAYKPRDWTLVELTLAGASTSDQSDSTIDDLRGVMLMRLSRPQEAVRSLLEAEKKHPGRYGTAANLGTAYELAGDLRNARLWIGEGISRDPQAHSGTEWLHLLILDARIELEKDPDWLRGHSVTGLDFGRRAEPSFKGFPENHKDFQKALEYQLRERMTFVAPPDAVVGDLLFDLANLTSEKASPHHTLALLRLAQLYNPTMARPLTVRMKHFRERNVVAEVVSPPSPDWSAYPYTRPDTATIKIEHVDIQALCNHLNRLVPEAMVRPGRRRDVTVHGHPESIRQIRKLVEILDQPGRDLDGS